MTADDFERLLVSELPRLRSFVRRLVGNAVDAEDVLQETIVRALRYRSSFDPRRAMSAWLARTAFRVSLDRGRRAAPVDDVSGVVPMVLDHQREVELKDEVTFLLRELSSIEREIVLAFHRDQQGIADIAARLAMPMGTVKSHLHRAREKLAGRRDGRST